MILWRRGDNLRGADFAVPSAPERGQVDVLPSSSW